MIYQTTKGVHRILRKSGCYFMDILRIFELVTEYVLSVKDVNAIFKLCVKCGYIGNNNGELDNEDTYLIKDAAKGISQIASGLTGQHCYIKRVVNEGDHNFMIGKYVHTGPHFILMPGPLNHEYDPWSKEGSRTVREGTFHSPRYYYGEKL